MIFEVELPEEADGEERTLRERRIGFYLRNGASIVDCAPRYRTPNLAGEDEPFRSSSCGFHSRTRRRPELAGELPAPLRRDDPDRELRAEPDDPLVLEVVDDLAC